MRKAGWIAAGCAGLVLTGCTAIRDHRGYLVDPALVDAVQPGIDNVQSVERSLGRPTMISAFGRKDWYYIATTTKQAAFSRPRAENQVILRVSFDDAGKVTGIQRSGMEHVVVLNPDKHRTPTLGKERSFLEDLFGNIGQVGAPGVGGGQDGNGPAPGRGPNGS